MLIVDAIEGALEGRDTEGHAPAPWLGWLTVSLCCQRVRQRWLVDVARARLSDVGEDEGEVPGLAGWRYHFHGSGLCLSGPGNEDLDYDFHDDEGRTIDPYFFAWRVARLDPAPLPDARVMRWLPSADVIVAGLGELRRLGVIEHPSSTHVFHLCPALEALAPRVVVAHFDDPRVRASFAEHLGDGELAGSASSGLTLQHREWLLSLLDNRALAQNVLRGIAPALPEEVLAVACADIIRGPVDAATGEAIEAMDRCSVLFVAEVDAVLDRLDPREHHPYAAWAAAKYLLARAASRERALATVVAFANVEVVRGYRGNPFADRLAMLLLEHEPDQAIPHVRRALRSSTPAVVLGMAALLAAIDRPWCHRELEATLRAPLLDERPSELSCRRHVAAALARCGGDLARRRAEELAPPRPVRAPGGIGFSGDEVLAHNADSSVSMALEHARPVAVRLRAQLPDDLL